MRYEKFDVVLVDLPVQDVVKDNINTGRKITTAGYEFNNLHPAVVLAISGDGNLITVLPMTSAQDSHGNEKWRKWWSHWARVIHNDKYNAVLVEQIRAASRERIQKKVGRLTDYDQEQVTAKLKNFLGL